MSLTVRQIADTHIHDQQKALAIDDELPGYRAFHLYDIDKFDSDVIRLPPEQA